MRLLKRMQGRAGVARDPTSKIRISLMAGIIAAHNYALLGREPTLSSGSYS